MQVTTGRVTTDELPPLLLARHAGQWEARHRRLQLRPGTWALRCAAEVQSLLLCGAPADQVVERATDFTVALWWCGALDVSDGSRRLERPLNRAEWTSLALCAASLKMARYWSEPQLRAPQEPASGPLGESQSRLINWHRREGQSLCDALALRWGARSEDLINTGQLPHPGALQWSVERCGADWIQSQWISALSAHLQMIGNHPRRGLWQRAMIISLMNPTSQVTRRAITSAAALLDSSAEQIMAERQHPEAGRRHGVRTRHLEGQAPEWARRTPV